MPQGANSVIAEGWEARVALELADSGAIPPGPTTLVGDNLGSSGIAPTPGDRGTQSSTESWTAPWPTRPAVPGRFVGRRCGVDSTPRQTFAPLR
eukprot:10842218-Lingulodinium_polyedra.AAC.1